MKSTLLPKFVKWLCQKCFRISVDGKYLGGSTNGHQSTLIIANHTSFIDGILLALFLPDNPVFVVNTDIAQNRFFKFFLNYVEHLTVDPQSPMAIKKVIQLLKSGKTVAIFPEGRITKTGSLMKIYAGAAFAATRAESTIIPVYISGAEQTYFSRVSHLYRRRLFPKIRLTILPPEKIIEDTSLPVRERRNDAKDKMHRIMMEMPVAARQKMSIYEHLLQSASKYGKNRLVYEDGLTPNLKYIDVVKKSVALSVILNKRELPQRVALMLPNSNPTILTFYAMQYLSKVPAMLNYTAGIRAIKAGMTACATDTIITSRAFIEKGGFHDLLTELSEYNIIFLEDLRETATVSDKLSIAVKRMFARHNLPQQNPHNEAVILFTSGSEGLPKGVVHSHDSMLMNATQIGASYDFTSSDKFMICLPMFHVFGLAAGALLPISSGAGAFLYPNPLHYRAIPEVVYDRDCTILLSTSTFLKGYARFADPYDFGRLRYVIAGAEKLSTEVINLFHEKFGLRILEGYGTTETAPVIAANTNMTHKSGSVGRLLPGINATLKPVAGIDTGGQLFVEADNVMLGYLHADNPDVLVPSPVSNGTRSYDTGDIVEIDKNGYIHIKGRAKRFAKIAGEMVSLDSTEKLAQHASKDHHHAVLCIPDAKKGEALVLFTTDETLNRKQLQQSAKELGLSELSIARDIRYTSTIPVFSSGKTNYPALTDLLLSNERT